MDWSLWDFAAAWTDTSWCPCGKYETQDAAINTGPDFDEYAANTRYLPTHQRYNSNKEILYVRSQSSNDDSGSHADDSTLSTHDISSLDELSDNIRVEEPTEIKGNDDIRGYLPIGTEPQLEPARSAKFTLQLDVEFWTEAQTETVNTASMSSNQDSALCATAAEILDERRMAASFESQQHSFSGCQQKTEETDVSTIDDTNDERSVDVSLTASLWKDCWLVAPYDIHLDIASYTSNKEGIPMLGKALQGDDEDKSSSATLPVLELSRQDLFQDNLLHQFASNTYAEKTMVYSARNGNGIKDARAFYGSDELFVTENDGVQHKSKPFIENLSSDSVQSLQQFHSVNSVEPIISTGSNDSQVLTVNQTGEIHPDRPACTYHKKTPINDDDEIKREAGTEDRINEHHGATDQQNTSDAEYSASSVGHIIDHQLGGLVEATDDTGTVNDMQIASAVDCSAAEIGLHPLERLPFIPDGSTSAIKKSVQGPLLRQALFWKNLEAKIGARGTAPSSHILAPVAKIAKETRYANVSKRSSYNGETFSVPASCYVAGQSSISTIRSHDRGQPRRIYLIPQRMPEQRRPRIGKGIIAADDKIRENVHGDDETLGAEEPVEGDCQAYDTANESGWQDIMSSPTTYSKYRVYHGPSATSKDELASCRSGSDVVDVGQLKAITQPSMTEYEGRIASTPMINQLNTDSLNRLFAGWCELCQPNYNITAGLSSGKVQVIKSVKVDDALKAADIRSILSLRKRGCEELLTHTVDTAHCICSCLLLALAPLKIASVMGICVAWSLNGALFYNALVPILERFAAVFQAIFALTWVLSVNVDMTIVFQDMACIMLANVYDFDGHPVNLHTGMIGTKGILPHSALLAFIALRGWQLAAKTNLNPPRLVGQDHDGALGVIWNCRSARLVLMVLPELQQIYRDAWGDESSASVSHLTLLVTDPDHKACSQLEQQLKETSLYRQGCVRYLRRSEEDSG